MMDDSTFLPLTTVSDAPEFRSLLVEKPSVAIIYLILLFLVSFWGGTTNFLILFVHALNKKLNKAGRIFLVNLCVADLCVSLVAIPFCIIGITHGEEYFQEHFYLCQFIGSFCFSVCICAVLNLLMATINRYTYVCHNHIYMRFFNSRTSLGTAIFIWVLALLIDSCNTFGWGGYTFDKKSHICVWDRLANFTFTLFVSIILIAIPLIFIAVLNILLLRRIHATKFNICMMHDVASIHRKRNAWIETLRASRTLFAMCIMFIICWFPYASVVAFDINDIYSEEVHMFITLLAHSHSASNFIIFWLCNKEFPQTVYQIFGFLFSCQKLSSKSLTSSSSTSSFGVGNTLQKRKCYFCCQCRGTSQGSRKVISTSVEFIRSDSASIIRKQVGGSFKEDSSVSESIYVIRHNDSSKPHAIGSEKERINCGEKVKERNPVKNKLALIRVRSDSREAQSPNPETDSGLF